MSEGGTASASGSSWSFSGRAGGELGGVAPVGFVEVAELIDVGRRVLAEEGFEFGAVSSLLDGHDG